MNLVSILSGYVDAVDPEIKHLEIEVEENGIVEQLTFVLNPTDTFGLSPKIRQELEDNPITFDAAPLPDIALLKDGAKRQVVDFADLLTEQVKNAPNGGIPYPSGEQDKWLQKQSEARSYAADVVSGNSIVGADYPYLWKLCDQDLEVLGDLAHKVTYHADRFEDAAVLIEQLRTVTFKTIDACTDQAQIDAVLDGAKATALASVDALLAPEPSA